MLKFQFSKAIAHLFDIKPAHAKRRRVHGHRLFMEPLEQRTMLSAVTFAAPTTVAVGTNPFSVTVGDFNGDGRTDLASANYGSNTVSVLLGNGNGTFPAATAATNFAVASRPRSVKVGDFNGDGNPDLVTANFVGSNVSVLLGNGDGTFGLRTNFAVGSNPTGVTVEDFNGDGKPDLATNNRYSHNVAVLLGNGLGGFGTATNFPVGTRPSSVTVGDFNGDGKPDLAAANAIGNNVSVLLGNGLGGFGPATNFPVGLNPTGVTVGDFNGDGKPDLATSNITSYNVSVLLNTTAPNATTPTFGAATNFGVGRQPNSVTMGDFNGDGKPDLATTSGRDNTVTVLTGNGDGTFGVRTDFPVGLKPTGVTVGNFNGDGKPDLATANYNSNNLSVLLNTTVPANTPPVVAANAAAVSANEGGTVSNTGTFSDAQGNSTVTFTAKVGGVTFGTVTKNDALGTWSWSANAADGPAGPFTVTIRATDNQNAAANATFTYAVNNVPPTISLSGNADVNEGALYTLNLGVVTDPGTDTITQYIVNWGDGTNSGLITGNPANTTATHTFADGPANLTNNVTVIDEDGNFLAGGLEVRVLDVAPEIALSGDDAVNEGSLYTLKLDAITDPGADIVTAYSIDWGDGNIESFTVNPANTTKSHTYTDGTISYPIRVSLTDDDGVHSNAGLKWVTVDNVVPSTPADNNSDADEVSENAANGTLVGVTASSTDPGVNDIVSYSLIDDAGGRFAIDSITGEVTVADGSLLDYEIATSHTITVQASDGVDSSIQKDFTINLQNVTASISGTVFVDVDGDGLFDGGTETALDGVIVELFNGDGDLLDSDETEMGGVYGFVVNDEFGTYRIRETQPTGVNSLAAILGGVGGSVLSSNEMQLALTDNNAFDYDFTEAGQTVQAGDTATIGFWQNKNGQALIKQGGTALANWLTTNFGNIFGNTFSNGRGGDDAFEVASFYKYEFFNKKLNGTAKVDAQFMATALATFFTSSNLSGGSVAASYGFNVTETGIGTKVINVGASGAAFGVANNTNMTIMSLLLATNNLTGADSDTNDSEDYSNVYDTNGDGVLDAAENALRGVANSVYTMINEGGDI